MNESDQILALVEDKSKILHDELRSNTDDRTTDGELYREILIGQIEVLDEIVKEIKLIKNKS